VASNTGPKTVELRNTKSLVADCVQESTENGASPSCEWGVGHEIELGDTDQEQDQNRWLMKVLL
jgi:hypothetical protein